MNCAMNKCDNCGAKKAFAKNFDMHWLGEDDCPITCDIFENMSEEEMRDEIREYEVHLEMGKMFNENGDPHRDFNGNPW